MPPHPSPPAKAKRVLVVDDEQEVTFALQAYFLAQGYEMLTALDGIQAMRFLRMHPIDLVLLDMKMPGVNGVEVLRFIHAQSPSTKVIVVTAYDDQFQERVERLGIDGFLMKPFGIEALTARVEEVLADRPHREAPAVSEEVPAPLAGSRPRARLLFVEPEYTFKLKEIYFTRPEECGGLYEVAVAESMGDALAMLESFRPDILLVDLAMLGRDGELPKKVMASAFRPKELIIHGSGSVMPPTQNPGMADLGRQGVKVVYNESFSRAGLARLGSVVRKTALVNGLAENAP